MLQGLYEPDPFHCIENGVTTDRQKYNIYTKFIAKLELWRKSKKNAPPPLLSYEKW